MVDGKGDVHSQTKVVTEPEAILAVLKPFLGRLRRVGHERRRFGDRRLFILPQQSGEWGARTRNGNNRPA